jgi:hypothetical protein
MIDWFLGLPWVLLAVLIAGGFSTFAVVGLSLARRWILPRFGHSEAQNDVTGLIHHGTLIIYGLAVALLAVAVWENNAEVTKIVSAEAAAIAASYRDADGYPEPTRSRLRAELKSYTEYIIHEAWPQQRRGKVPLGGVAAMDRFQKVLRAFEPATEGQRALHMEALRGFDALIHARRLRLDSISSGLPRPMWAVVVVGALITIFSAFFFDIGNARLHQWMLAMLAGVLGLLIFLIAFYDSPYRGSQGVTPEPYELIHAQLMGPEGPPK